MKKKNPLKELGIVGMVTYNDSLALVDGGKTADEQKTYWIKTKHFLEIALGNYNFEIVKKTVRTWIEPIPKKK
jgi:hypothetical protein